MPCDWAESMAVCKTPTLGNRLWCAMLRCCEWWPRDVTGVMLLNAVKLWRREDATELDSMHWRLQHASSCLQGKQGSWGNDEKIALFARLDTFVATEAKLSRSPTSGTHKAACLLLTVQTILSCLLVLEQKFPFAMAWVHLLVKVQDSKKSKIPHPHAFLWCNAKRTHSFLFLLCP